MTRAWRTVLLALILAIVGTACNGGGDKGKNKDLDVPKPADGKNG